MADVVITKKKITSLYLGFTGSISLQQIATSLGAKWTLPNNVLSISDPYLQYTASPFRLALSATITVPALHLDDSALLVINGGSNFSLTVSDPFEIIPGLM